MTGVGADSAAVAFFFINFNNFLIMALHLPFLLTFCIKYIMIFAASMLFLQLNRGFMKNYIPILKKTVLFSGVKEKRNRIHAFLPAGEKYNFKKGEFVLSQGQRLDNILILLDGEIIHPAG